MATVSRFFTGLSTTTRVGITLTGDLCKLITAKPKRAVFWAIFAVVLTLLFIRFRTSIEFMPWRYAFLVVSGAICCERIYGWFKVLYWLSFME